MRRYVDEHREKTKAATTEIPTSSPSMRAARRTSIHEPAPACDLNVSPRKGIDFSANPFSLDPVPGEASAASSGGVAGGGGSLSDPATVSPETDGITLCSNPYSSPTTCGRSNAAVEAAAVANAGHPQAERRPAFPSPWIIASQSQQIWDLLFGPDTLLAWGDLIWTREERRKQAERRDMIQRHRRMCLTHHLKRRFRAGLAKRIARDAQLVRMMPMHDRAHDEGKAAFHVMYDCIPRHDDRGEL